MVEERLFANYFCERLLTRTVDTRMFIRTARRPAAVIVTRLVLAVLRQRGAAGQQLGDGQAGEVHRYGIRSVMSFRVAAPARNGRPKIRSAVRSRLQWS